MIFFGFFLLSLLFLLISNVHAYIDPGSGSYILQVLIGFVLGVLYFIKHFWDKIRGLLKRK